MLNRKDHYILLINQISQLYLHFYSKVIQFFNLTNVYFSPKQPFLQFGYSASEEMFRSYSMLSLFSEKIIPLFLRDSSIRLGRNHFKITKFSTLFAITVQIAHCFRMQIMSISRILLQGFNY